MESLSDCSFTLQARRKVPLAYSQADEIACSLTAIGMTILWRFNLGVSV
jgi:hypothetical protein